MIDAETDLRRQIVDTPLDVFRELLLFDRSEHCILVEPVVPHVCVGPWEHLQLAGIHHFLNMYTGLGEPPRMLFPIRGVHNMCGLFTPVEAILVKRAKHPLVLVDGVEKSAHMISPGKIDTGELY